MQCTIKILIKILYLTIKNEIMPSAATWMNPEIAILSEVSQTETDIWYHLYVESKKKGANWLIYKTKIESQM